MARSRIDPFWELTFPGKEEECASILEWVYSTNDLLPMHSPLPDLNSRSDHAVPWRKTTGVTTAVEKVFSSGFNCRDYELVAEDLKDRYRIDLGPTLKDQGAALLIGQLMMFELKRICDLERKYLEQNVMLLGLGRAAASAGVHGTAKLRHDLLRNLFKLHLVTIAAAITDDTRFDCRVALEQWHQGNLIYGRNRETGQMLYICG